MSKCEAQFRRALERSPRFRRRLDIDQEHRIAQLRQALRARLSALGDAELQGMSDRALRDLVSESVDEGYGGRAGSPSPGVACRAAPGGVLDWVPPRR